MKKLKLLVCSICILLSSFVFAACGDNDDELDKIDASEIEITDEFEYNGNPHILVAKYDDEVISGITYSLDNATYKKADEFLEIVGSPDEDVKYLVYFKIELEGYEVYSGKLEVEVELPEIEIGVSYSNLTQTYDGTKKMFTIKHNGNVVTDVKYSLTQNGTYVSNLNLYDAKTYKVYFKFKLDGYAEYSSYKMFTIEKKELTADMFSLEDATGLVYTGEEHEVCVNIENSIVDIDDIDVEYENNVNAGTASVIISAQEGSNFTGSVTKTFNIAKKALTADMFSLENATGLVYTGSAQTPTAVVNGTQLVTMNDVDVAYTNNVNAGEATVTISAKADANFTGSVTKTFNIAKKEVTVTAQDTEALRGTEIADLNLTAKVDGLIDGESLNYSLSAKDYTAEVAAGTSYEIVIEEGNNPNYEITYTGAALYVTDVVIAAVPVGDQEDVELAGFYSDLNSAIKDAEDGTVLILNADIETDETIVINKSIIITSMTFTQTGECYTIKASDNFVGSNVIEASTSSEFTLYGVEVDANKKARAIKVSAGTFYLYNSKVTNGLTSTSFVGGVFVTGTATIGVFDSEITGNDYADSATDKSYQKVYSKDLWIGSQANGMIAAELKNSVIGTVFVNANEYSLEEAGLMIDGGKIDTVYVEYEQDKQKGEFYPAKLSFQSGEIKNLYISTLQTGEWAEVTAIPETFYMGGAIATVTVSETVEGSTDKMTYVIPFNDPDTAVYAYNELKAQEIDAYWTMYVAGENEIKAFMQFADELVLVNDTDFDSTLTIDKTLKINGQGKYKFVASDEFTGDNLILISTDVQVVLEDMEVNANSKARAIKISAGELELNGSKVTGGLSSSFVGGVFVTGMASVSIVDSEITGNDYVDSATDTAYQKAYSKDLWIGSQANGVVAELENSTIGYVFVNANSYSTETAGLKVQGGTLDTVYVEYDEGKAGKLNFEDGTINNLLVSTTTTGEWQEVVAEKGNNYVGGTDYSAE